MQLFIPIHHVHHAPPTQLSSQTALSHFAWNGKRSFVKRLPPPPPRQQSWSPVVLYGSSSGGLYMTSSRQHGPWWGSRNTPNLSYVGLILFWDRRKWLTYILCTSYMEAPSKQDKRTTWLTRFLTALPPPFLVSTRVASSTEMVGIPIAAE